MERNDCDWVEFEEMYGLCQWVGINAFYIVLFRLELVSSSNVIRFYSIRQIEGEGTAVTKKQATQNCALNLVQQLYHLGLVEAA